MFLQDKRKASSIVYVYVIYGNIVLQDENKRLLKKYRTHRSTLKFKNNLLPIAVSGKSNNEI